MSTRYVALGALLLLLTVACGAASADGSGRRSSAISISTAVATSERELQPVETFDTSTEAAIAAAAARHPGAVDLHVSRTVVILASQQIVDLRVQVTGDDVCDWYGVMGVAGANEIAWTAGRSAIGCTPAQ